MMSQYVFFVDLLVHGSIRQFERAYTLARKTTPNHDIAPSVFVRLLYTIGDALFLLYVSEYVYELFFENSVWSFT